MTAHPSWCVRVRCTANGDGSGAHRSAPIRIDATTITANLYATAAAPEVVYVEIHAALLLGDRAAYALGRVLTSLGKAALADPAAF